MSVLDTFYILFKTQGADQVKKDEDNVKKSSDDLDKSFKNTDASTIRLGQSMKNLGHQLVSFFSLATAGHAILAGFTDALSHEIQIGNVSRALKVNAEDLDAWGYAVEQVGGTAEGFQHSLDSMSKKLHISGEDALKILPQFADSFQKMGRSAAMNYGEVLGLDEPTIMLLQKGKAEVDAVIKKQKELGVVSKQNAEDAVKFSQAWKNSTHEFRSAFMEAANAILPFLTTMVEKFGETAAFFRKHSELIIGALVGIGIAAAAAAAPFLLWPAIIGGAIAVFALLWEDIRYAAEGKEASIIGKKLAESILGPLQEIRDTIKDIINDYKILKDLVVNFASKPVNIGTSFNGKANLPKYWEKQQPNEIYDSYKGSSKQNKLIDLDQYKNIDNLREHMDLMGSSPLASQRSNSVFNSQSSNKNMTINIGDINIQTPSGDPDVISKSIKSTLLDHLRQANNTFDDGVRI